MTRDTQTVLFTPSRRPVYRQAGIVGQEQGGVPGNFDRSTQDWVQDRNQQRLADHLNARSNSGDGRDAVRAAAAAVTLSYTSAGAGTQVRVSHSLNRTPTAIVFFRTENPNYRVVGNPTGNAGAFPNTAWTNREVYLNSNAPAGTVFEVDVG